MHRSPVASTARNARDWALAGAAQIVSNPRALLFLLAFLLLASLLSLRVLAAALGAFTLTHALAFALAVSGDAQMPTRIVEGGLAFLVALLGASAFLAARQAKPHRALAATLLVLAAACGFVQGFALAPLLRAHGLPAEGLTLSIAALVFRNAAGASRIAGRRVADFAASSQTLRAQRALRRHRLAARSAIHFRRHRFARRLLECGTIFLMKRFFLPARRGASIALLIFAASTLTSLRCGAKRGRKRRREYSQRRHQLECYKGAR